MDRSGDPASAATAHVRKGRGMVRVVVGLLIGAVLLSVLLMRIDGSELRAVLVTSEPLYLLPIVATLLCHYVFKGLRWRVLLSARASVPRVLVVRLTYVGYLMNNLLPARIGEVGRPYLLSLNVANMPFSFALATLVGDKLFDLAALVLALLLTLALLPLPEAVVQGMMAATAVCCVILVTAMAAAWWHGRERGRGEAASPVLRMTRRFGRKGGRIYDTLLTFAEGLSSVSSPRRFAWALVHSAASFVLIVTTVWCCLEMVGIRTSPMQCLFVVGFLGLSFLIPAPPTNAGNIHFFGIQALVLLGMDDLERAFAFSLIFHLSQVLTVAIVGLFSLIGLDWRRLRDLRK